MALNQSIDQSTCCCWGSAGEQELVLVTEVEMCDREPEGAKAGHTWHDTKIMIECWVTVAPAGAGDAGMEPPPWQEAFLH